MEKNRASQSSIESKVITLPLLLVFGIATLVYYLIMAAIYSLFGERLSSWLSNPLFGIAVFFITKWEATRRQHDITWRDLIKLPQLNLRKLFITIIIIFLVQFITGYASQSYLVSVRPDLHADDLVESVYAQFETTGSSIIFLTGAFLSYFIGGYMAGKLSPHRYQSPYGHAAVGGFIFYFVSCSIMQFLLVCKCGTPPTQEDIGWAVTWMPPYVSLSLFGAWVGTRTKFLHSLDTFGHGIIAAFSTTKIHLFSSHGAGSEPSVVGNMPEQHTAEVAKNNEVKVKAVSPKQRRSKKRKRG